MEKSFNHMKTVETPLAYYIPPKTVKHSQEVLTNCYHQHTRAVMPGKLFSFPDYPGVSFFVFRDTSGNKLWKVRESSTGIKAGTGYGQDTQAAAIREQWDLMEAMRQSKNGAGRHSYVLDSFRVCIAAHFDRLNQQNNASKAA